MPTPDTHDVADLLAVARHTDPAIARILCAAMRDHQAQVLHRALGPLINDARGRLVLVLDRVQQVTSAGINVLIDAQKECEALDGRLVVCGVRPELRELLHITRLDQMLAIADHEAQAVARFRDPQAPPRRRRLFPPNRAA